MDKNQRLNILITAYWCDPTKGSEAGVGWNFPKNMAQQHNVWVLTTHDNKKPIEDELAKNPVAGLSFIYYDIPKGFSILGFQLSHILWQLLLIRQYSKLSKAIPFDLIHHLVFNQYRSPSLGFFVKKPFIMGPIGGAEIINPVFYRDLETLTKLKERWRGFGLDRYILAVLSRLRKTPKIFVFSSNNNLHNLKDYINKKYKTISIPAIAINLTDFNKYLKANTADEQLFKIVYAGVAEDWKGILLFLLAAKKAFASNRNVLIKLIGIRSEEENKKVSAWINENGLLGVVQLINFMPRSDLIKELSIADLSVYPAFRDSGSMSVLEACSLGCTVLCFDAGGQDMFPDDILIKVPVSGVSYQANVDHYADKLSWAFSNRSALNEIGANARNYVFEHFTWEKKVEMFGELYKELINRR